MAASLVAFQYAIQEGPRQEWFSSGAVSLAAVLTLVAGTIFVRGQLRAKVPLVDFNPFRSLSFSAGTVLAIVSGMGVTGTSFIMPLYFQQVLGFDLTAAGLGMIPAAVGTTVAIHVGSTPWARRLSPVLVAIVGLALFGIGTLWFCLLGKNVGFDQIIVPRFVQGLGNGLSYVPLNVLIMRGVPRKWYDAASGLGGLARQLGMTLGYAALSAYLVHMQTAAATDFLRRVHVNALGASLGLRPIRDFLVAHGIAASDAATYAPSVLQQLVLREATLWGFNQTLFAIGVLSLVSIPAVAVFWRTGAVGAER
jgi:DHA2 family multidrug resistance protein